MRYSEIKINTLYSLSDDYCIYFFKESSHKNKKEYECFGFERDGPNTKWHILPGYYDNESYNDNLYSWKIAEKAPIKLYRKFLSRFFSEKDIEYLDEIKM
jgi:hypothetical protein